VESAHGAAGGGEGLAILDEDFVDTRIGKSLHIAGLEKVAAVITKFPGLQDFYFMNRRRLYFHDHLKT